MSDNNRLYEVHLALTSDNDPELFELSCHMRQESYPGQEAWSRLGALLLRMGQANTAEEIYQTLLRQTTDDSERAPIYERLSLAKYSQGKYQETITFCTKVLTIYQQTSSSEPINLANVYNRMGSAYLQRCDLQPYKDNLARVKKKC
ncbi:hypothetical protein I4U23_004729 [Adineta vaga]|nr:hypothetical protein I4U23_004729 [Adineta vaga]